MPITPWPSKSELFKMTLFKDLNENSTIANYSCADLIAPGWPRDFLSPSRCGFYKNRVTALRARGDFYASKSEASRPFYMARDNACEKAFYDSPEVNVSVCERAQQQLENHLESVRKGAEAKTFQDATEIARLSAGARGNEKPPPWAKQPIPVGFEMLFSDEAKAEALTRIGAKRNVLSQNVEREKIRLQNARASVDIGVGVGKVCGGDFHHDDGCCCRSDIRCGGDPGKPVWDSGHWHCWGGDSIGKLNAEWAGGNRLPCPAGYPDRIDGLCYKACPASHPLHIKGMPYLCARSADTDGAIRDQFNYDNYDKADAEHAISCAEAVRDRNQAGIEEHCGFDARAKSKAMWEDVATKLLSGFTFGAWDIINLINKAVADKWGNDEAKNHDWSIQGQVFGHPNRGGAVFDKEGNYVGGEKGAGDLHIDGVIDAFLRTKDIATEEACLDAIENENLQNYLKYCPLFEEVKPTVLDDRGQPQIRAILPPAPPFPPVDASGNITDPNWQITQAQLPPWDVPDVPQFNEDLLPPVPPELLEDLPAWLLPNPDIPDMVPPKFADDIVAGDTRPNSSIFAEQPNSKYNILDHPNHLALTGAFLLALLSIR